MRVSIDHKERSVGLFKKKVFHDVILKVEFSAEERAVLESIKEKTIVIERPPPAHLENPAASSYNLTITGILDSAKHPDVHVVSSPQEAKAYEEQVKEDLQALKGFIEENSTAPTSSTFEL